MNDLRLQIKLKSRRGDRGDMMSGLQNLDIV
jgi:Tfp pilus assembly ATPase PilU